MIEHDLDIALDFKVTLGSGVVMVFGEDAEVASKVLGLTLTKRHETPMAGLPYHAAPAYINRLLAAGWSTRQGLQAGQQQG